MGCNLTESRKKRVVVLVSGSGTNLQALMDDFRREDARGEIVLVVSNRAVAYGLTRAEQAGIPTLYFPLKPYKDVGKSREDYDVDLAQTIMQSEPDLVVLAGWMHIVTAGFIEALGGRVINLHPALPNQFAGTHAIERAFEAYQRGEIIQTGCMVHYVVPEVDAGPVIGQAVVPILPDDTLDTLETRLHAAEHQLIVEAVNSVLSDID
jgi:formyltetrahydrofolate-dependent phosphoribosylglycinamide formyltransferase